MNRKLESANDASVKCEANGNIGVARIFRLGRPVKFHH